MRWPFSKKPRALAIPPLDEQRWSVTQGEYDGNPLLVRFNESGRVLAGHPALPIKLAFAAPLRRPIPGGLPDSVETEELVAIEDLVVERVFASTIGVFALTLTTGAMKEFVFYITPGLDVAPLHAGLQRDISSHDLQCIAIEEPGWDSYRAFVS